MKEPSLIEAELSAVLMRTRLTWMVVADEKMQVNAIEVGSWDGPKPIELGSTYCFLGDMVPIRLSPNLEPGEFRIDVTFLKRQR